MKFGVFHFYYNIRFDGHSEYLMKLADFVDSRVPEISSGTLMVDSLKVVSSWPPYISPTSCTALKQLTNRADGATR